MSIDFISLFTAALVAACAPIIARAVPRELVPETVILLLAGALLGPHMAGAIQVTDSISMLSELGLAFLFLLAGYEINPKSLSSTQGKKGLASWAVSIVLAFAAVYFLTDLSITDIDGIAVAIALTTTALGALMPILKERKLSDTPVGECILAFGTWGEVCPVLAMALLLTTRTTWQTLLILALFAGLCVIMAVVPSRARKAGHTVYRFLAARRNTTSQTLVRATVVMLIGLVTVSAVFDLDIVLGAFAAGFVLRYVIPEGDHELESKLEAIGYGFLIPVFFVVSGAKIDLAGVGARPVLLVGFIVMLLLIRAVPIVVALSVGRGKNELSMHNRVTVALYCTTALPIIVAVTSLATKAGAMSQDTAGVLVAAGAITVFLMPLLASLTYRVVDAKPIEAVQEIAQHPSDIRSILHEHLELERMMARQEIAARMATKARAEAGKDVAWEDVAFALQRQSRRKRAMDEMLDFARREYAAHEDELHELGAKAALTREEAAERTAQAAKAFAAHLKDGNWEEERRIAERAVREYRRRMRELGHAAHHEDDGK